MKRKTLTLCLSLLACLSLIGVGFAAWVISGGDTQDAAGNITVDTVKDERFEITAPTIADSIHYGITEGISPIADAWLTNDSDKKENLTVTFEVTVTSKSDVDDWSGVQLNVNVAAPTTQAWADAFDADLVVAPTATAVLKAGSTTARTAVYTVTVTAAWGSYFTKGTDVVNPYTFYNSHEMTDIVTGTTTYADDAVAKLGLIEALGEAAEEGKTANYVVTVSIA